MKLRPLPIRAFLLSSAILMSGVAMTGCDTITNLFISNGEEVEIGAQVADQIYDEYKLLDPTDPVAQWADSLVQEMVEASTDFRDPEVIGGYKVHVIYDNDLVNAFAAPGGFVYIASGLVLQTKTCGEVAGVVGHELAHVTERHSVKAMTQAAVTLGLTNAALKEGLTKEVANGVYGFLMNTTFSRKDESEADDVGTKIMHGTGYNPYALAHMFEKLAELNEGREPPEFLSSHPASAKRATAIREEIEENWPGEIQETGDPVYTYDCITQGVIDYSEVQSRLQAGSVKVLAGSGMNPTVVEDDN